MCFRALINYIDNRERYPVWHGYALAAGFFVVSSIQFMCQNMNFYLSNSIGMKIKTALVAAVYKKVRA
jgi:hypothetical protein